MATQISEMAGTVCRQPELQLQSRALNCCNRRQPVAQRDLTQMVPCWQNTGTA